MQVEKSCENAFCFFCLFFFVSLFLVSLFLYFFNLFCFFWFVSQYFLSSLFVYSFFRLLIFLLKLFVLLWVLRYCWYYSIFYCYYFAILKIPYTHSHSLSYFPSIPLYELPGTEPLPESWVCFYCRSFDSLIIVFLVVSLFCFVYTSGFLFSITILGCLNTGLASGGLFQSL